MAEVATSKERVKKKKSSFEPDHEILLLKANVSHADPEGRQGVWTPPPKKKSQKYRVS